MVGFLRPFKGGNDDHDIARVTTSLMNQVNIRTLVNGEGDDVKNDALSDLFGNNFSPEQIEADLRRISRLDPKVFAPKKVEDVILWTRDEWSKRLSQRKPR